MKKRGFTLVEIMVVVLIIGGLSMLVFPNFKAAMLNAKEKDAKILIGKLDSAVMAYYKDHPNDTIFGGPITNFALTSCPSTPSYQSIFHCGYSDELPSKYADSRYDFYICNPFASSSSESNYCNAVKYAVMVDSDYCYGYNRKGEFIKLNKLMCESSSGLEGGGSFVL